MSSFSIVRFRRVMLNDLLRAARPVLYASAALLGVIVAVYMMGFRNARSTSDPVHVVLFGICFIVTGLLFTGAVFRDIHHPLERNQYLMLPVSNLERLLSRYLLSGPFLALYATLAYMGFDYVANQLTHIWINKQQPLFSPASAGTIAVIRGYLIAHVAVFTGAICFRSFALLKTIVFLLGVLLAQGLVEYLSLRLLFPELFSWTGFMPVREFPVELEPWFTVSWLNLVFVVGAFAWMIRIAYLCLRDHEATDGV
jgi:hypothetical protein